MSSANAPLPAHLAARCTSRFGSVMLNGRMADSEGQKRLQMGPRNISTLSGTLITDVMGTFAPIEHIPDCLLARCRPDQQKHAGVR